MDDKIFNVINAFNSAHVNCDVWIKIEFPVEYSTCPVDIKSNLIDVDIAFYIYIIQSFNSAHVKCGVLHWPKKQGEKGRELIIIIITPHGNRSEGVTKK